MPKIIFFVRKNEKVTEFCTKNENVQLWKKEQKSQIRFLSKIQETMEKSLEIKKNLSIGNFFARNFIAIGISLQRKFFGHYAPDQNIDLLPNGGGCYCNVCTKEASALCAPSDGSSHRVSLFFFLLKNKSD